MKIFRSIIEFHSTKKTILTLGTFDGVHLGHRKILERISQNTEHGSFESLVLTFFPHPRMVLNGQSDVKLLNTIEEKIELLKGIGVQNLVIHPFDETFSNLSAIEFVKSILVDKLHIQKIIIGHDHRFGKNRTANFENLVAFGKQFHFEVEQISVQEIQDVAISSTKIRNALLSGDIESANNFLGYEYFLTGTVYKGKQLGRTIGYPTANITIDTAEKLIPREGVYVVKSRFQDKTVFGMMNIGLNPTVEGKKLAIEVYYFDFNADLYDQEIQVSLLKYLRSEQKFESVALLREQLHKDESVALAYIKRL